MANHSVLGRLRRGHIAWVVLNGLSLVGVLATGCASLYGQSFWGPFRGHFVDVDTGQPIPGAVIAAVWREEKMTPVSSVQEYYAAEVAVADRDGRFEVPAPPRPLAGLSVTDPVITWFAPGYRRIDAVVVPPTGTRFVDPTTIRLGRADPVGR